MVDLKVSIKNTSHHLYVKCSLPTSDKKYLVTYDKINNQYWKINSVYDMKTWERQQIHIEDLFNNILKKEITKMFKKGSPQNIKKRCSSKIE